MPANAHRLSMLVEMGITWYVPTNFDASSFNISADGVEVSAPIELVSSDEAPVRLEQVAAVVRVLDRSAVSEAPDATPVDAEPTSPSPVIAVEPFHWLIAQSDFVHFVCDIKQARLAPVWHSAAQELLADIAIALGAKTRLSSEYFSWPPTAQSDALTDADLPDFLAEYLTGSNENGLYILMGESAHEHVSALVLKGRQRVLSVPLGQLFRDPEQKKGLWQQLKPLRR